MLPNQMSLARDYGIFVDKKNLSQTELGKLVGVHYTHVGRYERGISKPAAETLTRLANVLGVSGDYLLEWTTTEAAKAKFEDRELLYQFQEVEKLPDEDKVVVKKQIQTLAARWGVKKWKSTENRY